VNDISIVKAPEDMEYGIGFSNVPQELVAEPLSLAGSLDQARDVDNFDRVGMTFCGFTNSASFCSRGSGTVMIPTLGSIVQKGKFAL